MNQKITEIGVADLWVQIQNLPLNWQSKIIGMKIDSVFQKVKELLIHQNRGMGGK